MFNNVALDVVIGLVFVYLLYSLLGTLLQEIIATNVGLRGFMLQKAIRRMLDDEKTDTRLSDEFYGHPLIKYLADGSWPLKKKPSYITSDTFSKVIIDLLRGQGVAPGSPDRQIIQDSLDSKEIAWNKSIPICAQTALYLNSMWADAQGDIAKFKLSLGNWFNETMDRTTGWYKKYTQIILLGIGFIIAVAFNADTIKIISILEKNPSVRSQIVNQASAFIKAHPNLDQEIKQTQSRIDSLSKSAKAANTDTTDSLKHEVALDKNAKDLNNQLYKQATDLVGNDINSVNSVLAIGWKGGFCKNISFLSLLGWILTALAVSLGAPFWFDLLNKLMQLRSSVANKDDSAGTKPSDGATPATSTINRVG